MKKIQFYLLLCAALLCISHTSAMAQKFTGGSFDGASFIVSSVLTLNGTTSSYTYTAVKYFGGQGDGASSTAPSASVTLDSDEPAAATPREFALAQNYPNPFNPSTGIRYQVSGTSDVRLEVFDMLGRKVSTLVNERKAAGSYQVNFNAATLASGIYFYRLDARSSGSQAGTFSETRRMMLVK
jgi:hypothetical protein